MDKLFKRLSVNSDNLQLEMIKEDNLKIITDFTKDKNIRAKVLFTALLFYHNLDNIANIKNDEELTRKILSISKEIVNRIIKGEDLEDLLIKYNEVFFRWKEADKKQKEDLEKQIKINTTKLMKKAFWDKIYQDLGEKNNQHIELLLIELKENIQGLCLKDSMRESIDKQFDIDIIKQIIDHDAMTERDFDMFFGNLARTVRSLQSPANDKALDEAIQIIQGQIKDDWKAAFISSMKVLSEAVSEIYIDLVKLKN